MKDAGERYLRQGIVEVLRARTAVDASCDVERIGDVRLLLDDGTTMAIDAEVDTSAYGVSMAEWPGRSPWPPLTVRIGGRELRP